MDSSRSMKGWLAVVAIALAGYWVRSKLLNVGKNGFSSATTAEQVSEGIDLSGKVAIITGAASGIGWDTARVLALRGATVVVVARSDAKAQEAVDTMKKFHPDKKLSFIPMGMDLDSLTSVEAFAAAFLAKNIPLNILILNAGIMALKERALTEFGVEKQMGTNHVAHFYLARLLTPKLIESAPARVVSLASSAHRLANASYLDSPILETEYDEWIAYGNSKASNVLFAREFHRRYHSQGITAASVHPGGIWTGLQKHVGGFSPRLILFNIISPIAFKSTTQGAATSVYCATSPELDTENLGGRFFEDCHVSKTINPHVCEDDANALKLWEATTLLLNSKLKSKTE